MDDDVVDVLEFVQKCHRAAAAAPVVQLPFCTGRPDGLDHRQNRGDADAARNEYVTWGFDEREVVAWAADVDCGSSEQGLVDVLGSAPALRLTQDGDSPHRAIARVAAERVLPYEP